jgi:hypothetical protein
MAITSAYQQQSGDKPSYKVADIAQHKNSILPVFWQKESRNITNIN